MRTLLTACCLLIALQSVAQTRAEQRRLDSKNEASLELFDNDKDDADFYNYSIPENFLNAPAVILCQKNTYTHDATPYTLKLIKEFHTKILVNEKTALEDFATIYFDIDMKQGDKIAIKLLKKNGTINEITAVKDALKVDKGKVPSVYRTYGNENQDYYKLAIPNLEVGDTLEYIFFIHVNVSTPTRDGGVNTFAFYPTYRYLNSTYPVVKQKLLIDLGPKLYLSAKSMHGAPELKKINSDDRKRVVYYTEDVNRAAVEDQRWLYTAREMPCIKFQPFYAPRKPVTDRSIFFISDDAETIKSSISKDDIKAKVTNKLQKPFVKSSPAVIAKAAILKKLDASISKGDSKEKILESYHNYLRSEFREYATPAYDEYFLAMSMYVLNKYDIPFDIVVVPNRITADKETALFTDDLMYCLRVNEKFIFPTQRNSQLYASDISYVGQDGWIAKVDDKGKRILAVDDITIPNSLSSENQIIDKLYIEIQEDNFEKINLIDTCYYSGLAKRTYTRYNSRQDELGTEEDDTILFDEDEKKERARRNTARREEQQRKETEAEKQTYDKVKKELAESLKEDYSNLIEVDTFAILNTGSFAPNTALVEKIDLEIGDLIKKVGPNYIVELGKAIGSQVEVKKDEQNRKNGVWINYPSEYNKIIRMKIPAGYTVDGLQNFNFNIDNAAGKFTSTAIQKNGYVEVDFQKVYKKNYLTAAEWPNLVSMLDAAYDFTQKQLVLKK